jgi:SWI/SNF-related matrix-associated actin-dependent regulator of chromatin subfamily A member 5
LIIGVFQGFSSWSRRDFNTFIRACEKYGRNDIQSIVAEMDGKTEEEVERYAKAFKERYKELNGKLCPIVFCCSIR